TECQCAEFVLRIGNWSVAFDGFATGGGYCPQVRLAERVQACAGCRFSATIVCRDSARPFPVSGASPGKSLWRGAVRHTRLRHPGSKAAGPQAEQLPAAMLAASREFGRRTR